MQNQNEKKSNFDISIVSQGVLKEIGAVLSQIPAAVTESLCTEILNAHRIVCFGVGREGLMMKAFCMRLMHLGLDVHMAGDMTTPRVGQGDLLMASAGPGVFSTVLGLMTAAKDAGARTLLVTAQPGGLAARTADAIIYLPAQTMADDKGKSAGILPMGSLFETVQLIFFDLAALALMELTGQTTEQMRGRHTNLE